MRWRPTVAVRCWDSLKRGRRSRYLGGLLARSKLTASRATASSCSVSRGERLVSRSGRAISRRGLSYRISRCQAGR